MLDGPPVQASELAWSSDLADSAPLRYRPVTIINASALKQLKLRIEVPVEDMARLSAQEELPSGPASQAPRRVSIWNAIHPRLLELIRERNSTILFVNSRQVAERPENRSPALITGLWLPRSEPSLKSS
jgi:ATP-dependent Lhr-like helicase